LAARLTVTFKHKIRSEQRFDSLAALTQQIARDVEQARSWLGSQRG
jgi:riboflavin kinase/FMN adenylyltransferase